MEVDNQDFKSKKTMSKSSSAKKKSGGFQSMGNLPNTNCVLYFILIKFYFF